MFFVHARHAILVPMVPLSEKDLEQIRQAMIEEHRPRGLAVWHRRAGKDVTCWNIIIYKAMERIGLYFYCFPKFTQGRKIIWDGMGRDGRRYLDYIPEALIANVNHTEMKIELVNGSLIQLVLRAVLTKNARRICKTSRGQLHADYQP